MDNSQAFDQAKPPLSVTNPPAAVAGETDRTYREFPRHLHKADGSYIEVGNDIDKAAKLADGWHLTPDAAKAAAVAAVVQDADGAVPEEAPKRRPGRPAKADAA